jgi:hypothetical protein
LSILQLLEFFLERNAVLIPLYIDIFLFSFTYVLMKCIYGGTDVLHILNRKVLGLSKLFESIVDSYKCLGLPILENFKLLLNPSHFYVGKRGNYK